MWNGDEQDDQQQSEDPRPEQRVPVSSIDEMRRLSVRDAISIGVDRVQESRADAAPGRDVAPHSQLTNAIPAFIEDELALQSILRGVCTNCTLCRSIKTASAYDVESVECLYLGV